jgi:hypothetical protein
MELDPGIHIVMHSVLFLKPGVTIGSDRCEKFWPDFIPRTCALMAPVRHILHQSSYSNETVRNTAKHEFGIQWGVDRVRSLRKISTQLHSTNLCINGWVRPVLHRSLCSNKIIWIAPKHEFGVQWGGSGAFVVKNFNATSFHELVH